MDREEREMHLLSSLATEGKCISYTEQFNERIKRYSRAKFFADCNYQYIREVLPQSNKVRKVGASLRDCGSYLVFSHYYTKGEIRLTKASLCKKHLLCPLCAIRRGAKTLESYLSRYHQIIESRPTLKAYMVTLTVKNGDDLNERVSHLRNSWTKYTKNRKRDLNETSKFDSAVYSIEVKRGQGSGKWHPHMHMIWLSEEMPDQQKLSEEWKAITGDSYIVDVRPITPDDPVKGFLEVFKYAVKFSSQSPEDTWHCFDNLSGTRLLNSMGGFRGIKEPELLDEEDESPYVELFFKFTGKNYSYIRSKSDFDDRMNLETEELETKDLEADNLESEVLSSDTDYALKVLKRFETTDWTTVKYDIFKNCSNEIFVRRMSGFSP